jgi:hypothetical protein
MRESRVITEIHFDPAQGVDVRGSLTFSDPTKVRLDPADLRLKLRLNSDFRYPTDADLAVRTRTYEPAAVRQLLMLQVVGETPVDEDGAAVTSIGLRLFDGTDERFWGGANWDVAGPGDWSTEAEVNANLATFDVSARKFGVVFNLATTDDRLTPTVLGALVLWRGPVDWVDDLLVDSLVGMFQDELTYVEDLALPPLEADASSIDLDDYVDEGELEFVGADAVFDHTADAEHATDLLTGYDVGTRVLTLASAIPAGNVPFLRMLVRPHVAWDTAQDFSEIGKLPSVVLRDAQNVVSCPYPERSAAGIVRKDTGAAVKTGPPYRATYEIEMEVNVDRTTTQARLMEEVLRIFQAGPPSEVGPFLRSRATDRRYRLRLIEEFRAVDPRLNLADVRSFKADFRIEDAALDLKPARDLYAVQKMNLDFAAVPSDVEAEARAAGAPIPTSPTETIEVS